MSKVLSVTVPFKENEKWMYDIIATHSSKSAFIKDILAEKLKEDKTNIPKTNDILTTIGTTKINTDNLLDF